MAEPPTGTVTFLFSDLEGSTRLWEEYPDAMESAMAHHDEILRGAVESHGGYVVKMTGDGIHAVFATARDAVDAAIAAQLGVKTGPWDMKGPLRVRMGLHTCEAEHRDGDYYGAGVNRAARLMTAAHGGQVVLSHATEEVARDALDDDVVLLDLGEHRLRDLTRPERVFQIRHPRLPSDFPALRSIDQFPGDLPVSLTSFVGRDREFRSVVDALRQSRIVTVIGVGGVGKTRLALQVAADVLPEYSDGAWFCELAPVTNRRAVPEALFACLGLREHPGESLSASLLAYLGHKQLLLVLDNCEHVIDAAGSLADAIVHGCPQVAVLATSREALGVDGELLRPLGSLAVPAEDTMPADVTGVDSVRLFTDRARAVRPDFVLDPVSAPVVADICRQLDGVPLAIELAAARIGSLTVSDIAQRLDQRFRLLTGGRRAALERHQTLRGAVDWSYELLDDIDARVFNRLAVFVGGFTLAAAEAVVSGAGIEVYDVIDVLSRLVARSMVVANQSEDTMRYRLLETMRQYARERLDAAGEHDVIRRRHAEHYAARAEAVQVGLEGRDEEHCVSVLDMEFPNFRAALNWSIGMGDADLALCMIMTLSRFGLPRLRYAVSEFQLALDMPEARHHRLRPDAMAWVMAGIGAFLSGDVALIASSVRAMDAAFEEAGRELTSEAHVAHAVLASLTREPAEVAAHGIAAIELARKTGDRYLLGFRSAVVAMLLATFGDTGAAMQRAEEAHLIGTESGNPTLLALSETALGYALSTVDPDRAIPHLKAGMSMANVVGNDMAYDIGGRCLARILATRDDLAAALEIHARCLDTVLDSRARLQTMLACESLAVDLARAGYNDIAATILGALEARTDAYQGNPIVPRQAAIEAIRRSVGESHLEECAARGRALDTDDLTAFARAEVARIIAELSAN